MCNLLKKMRFYKNVKKDRQKSVFYVEKIGCFLLNVSYEIKNSPLYLVENYVVKIKPLTESNSFNTVRP